jgi:hypothetical protein
MFYLLNTVSYAAMTLSSMIDEEKAYLSSPEYLKMQKKEQQQHMMADIYQTMRTGKRLPMFAPHHKIRPLSEEKVDAPSIS